MSIKNPKVSQVSSNLTDEDNDFLNAPKPAKQETGDSAIDDQNGVLIPRIPWQIHSDKNIDNILSFNVNPSTVDFNFNGRGSITQTGKARVIDRVRASDSTGYFDVDITFNMQSGNLLTPDGTISLGHKTIYRILEIMNEDLFTENNDLNMQHLFISSTTFGFITLDGFLDIQSLSISESADEPFKREYQLTFNVFKISPTIRSFDALVEAYS